MSGTMSIDLKAERRKRDARAAVAAMIGASGLLIRAGCPRAAASVDREIARLKAELKAEGIET